MVIPLLPALLGFWGLTLFQSNSWKLGNLFIICFFSSALILFFLSRYFLSWLEKIFKHSTLPLRLATRSLSRNRSHSVTGFLALGLGVLLLTLIPQFQYSLEKKSVLTNHTVNSPNFSYLTYRKTKLDQL